MTKVLVLYYSAYGHIQQMAHAVAEGAHTIDHVTVDLRRVSETVPAEVRSKSCYVDDATPGAPFQGEHVARIAQRLKNGGA
ncbi:hypothetical protein BI364_10985 [Acidihalobacter yilgarnensis]|uniref:Flavodoxin-like domain-containing protein n=1 Tax=Acidihalobacter yilgarnensis TaxID=2819280 RepID=A0A1D8IPL4_9GAMM|nr:flavodoxin domain-containing protein [Acidihalobacter yilgarnensis]AOU98412.1 hypothetical protein BI364_10985 [Acidihalobacter yilgarnensis]